MFVENFSCSGKQFTKSHAVSFDNSVLWQFLAFREHSGKEKKREKKIIIVNLSIIFFCNSYGKIYFGTNCECVWVK